MESLKVQAIIALTIVYAIGIICVFIMKKLQPENRKIYSLYLKRKGGVDDGKYKFVPHRQQAEKGKGSKASYPRVICRTCRSVSGIHWHDRTWNTDAKFCNIPGYAQRTESNG